MTLRATRPSAPEWLTGEWYPGRTSASYLDECAIKVPGSLAVREADVRLTYGELYERAVGLAGWFGAHGVAGGDVVTFQLPNWWESTVVYQALSRHGCVVNPVVPIYRQRELAFILHPSSQAPIPPLERTPEPARRLPLL